MENQKEKNYTKVINEDNAAETATGSKVIIHTMPKRYMMQAPSSKGANSKSTGFVILILGFMFLIVSLVVLYLYVLRKPAQIEVSKDDTVQVSDGKDKTSTSTQSSNSDQGGNAETPIYNDKASSSEVMASTTGENPDGSGNGSSIYGGKYVIANDSDKDGLSDIEELLLGSSPNSDDTDGDSYNDGMEVLNLYDPASKGKLIDSLSIEELVNEDYNFLLFVASLWTIKKVDNNNSLIISLGKSQYIQIISQDKPAELSLDDWYMDLFEVSSVEDSQRFKKGNWNGIIANNSLTYYLEHPNKKHIITLNYEVSEDTTLYYKNLFDMMIKSIAINK